MKLAPDGTLRFSPSDLTTWLEGDFAAWCDHAAAVSSAPPLADGLPMRPDPDDPEAELLKRKGLEHEHSWLQANRAQYADLVEVETGPKAAEETLAAMRRGVSMIYQGYLTRGRWHGYPDFLRRVEGASGLGDYHYQPIDTKLARSAKPYFVIQLCEYAEMLLAIQGCLPNQLWFRLGDGQDQPFDTNQYIYYHRHLRRLFEVFHDGWNASARPDPGLDRGYGRWSALADRIKQQSDHLSGVANITRDQIARLESAGLTTFTALATTSRADVPEMSRRTFRTLHQQAELQYRSAGRSAPLYARRESLDERARRGLGLLPPLSTGDVFFDLEGFPFAQDGLEYLWGAATPDGGFHDWWAHDHVQQRRAFESFMRWTQQRRCNYPDMHIYHYASYEENALKRLASRYGSCESELDDLLRNDVLVDLFTVLRQALVVGTPSYSLKDIERLYSPPRSDQVSSAAGSVVEYQRWLDSREPQDWHQSPRLRAIRDYNERDCISTRELAEWLRARQVEYGVMWAPMEPAAPPQRPKSARRLAEEALRRATLEALQAKLDSETDPERARVTQLVMHLAEFHRRESKPTWWEFFRRLEMTPDELLKDHHCIADLERTDRAEETILNSRGLEYRFPNQEIGLKVGDTCVVASTIESERIGVEIAELNAAAGTVMLKLGPGRPDLPTSMHLIHREEDRSETLAVAVYQFAESWCEHPAVDNALTDLLFRRPPRIRGHAGGTLLPDDAPMPDAAIDLIRRMEQTVISIQGPPGSGKTFTAAAVIAVLVQRRGRIAVAANSHKVVMNLLCAVEEAMRRAGVTGRIVKIGDADAPVASNIEVIKSAGADTIGGDARVVGGTAWAFARPALAGKFDYLFVDEAGQVCLANVVAMGQSARNIVLIGDQRQLSQPIKGVHPGDSGKSALDYIVGDNPTIPRELGIFLARSWRMRSEICRVVSDAFYQGRLQSDASTDTHQIFLAPGTALPIDRGVVFWPVTTTCCEQDSREEADAVARIIDDLLAARVSIKGQLARPMTLRDILVVAPFNRQVQRIKQRFPDARVGSVDLFQGQEAAVSIVSMCASTLEDAPRGAGFLLSPNRLNVAISRAQILSVVVGSTELAAARCSRISEMALVSTWCRVVYPELRHQAMV